MRRAVLLATLLALRCSAEQPAGPDAPPRFLVRGSVSGAGTPLADVRVAAEARTAGGFTLRSAVATGLEGEFALELARGTWRLRFSKEGWRELVTDEFELAADRSDFAPVLMPVPAPLFIVGGRVVPAGADSGIAGADVSLLGADGASLGKRRTPADGSFQFEVEAGRYRLQATAAGYQEHAGVEVEVVDASHESVLLALEPVVAPPGFRLAGTVRDASGPLADVLVGLSQSTPDGWLVRGRTTTDAAGAFAFADVAGGTYRLDLSKPGYKPAVRSPVEMAGDVLDVAVELQPDVIDRFRFAIQSDVHITASGAIPPGFKDLVRGTLEHVQPSFVLFAGDLTSGNATGPDDAPTVDWYWDSFFAAVDGFLPAGIAYFPARGNHDFYTAAQRQAWQERWQGHRVPGVVIDGDPAAWYSFTFGNSHFTVLASSSQQLGTAQVDWLQSDLAGAQAATHRFVVSHIPLVATVRNSSGGTGHGTIAGSTSSGKPVAEVLRDGRITALFTGHEHVWHDTPAAAPGVRQVGCGTASGTYNFPFLDGTQQQLVPSMVVVDVQGPQVSVRGVRDAPRFSTTWDGAALAPAPPRRLLSTSAPAADILVVDGWQRGRLDGRAQLRARGLAMFSGLADTSGRLLAADVVSQAALAADLVNPADYAAVVWLLSNESAEDLAFSEKEQSLVAAYVAGGGRLVVSGSETGYDLAAKGHGASFLADVLQAEYVADDAARGDVQGVAGTPFAGLAARFDEASDPWRFPDVIRPRGSQPLVRYGDGRDAAVGARRGDGGVVYFAFALDGLTDESARSGFAAAALRFLGLVP